MELISHSFIMLNIMDRARCCLGFAFCKISPVKGGGEEDDDLSGNSSGHTLEEVKFEC